MTRMIQLFVYGQLMNPHEPYDLAMRGEMRMRTRNDPGAKFGPEYASKVWGQVRHMTQAQLKRTDHYEHPEYKMKALGRYKGAILFAFECVGDKWEEMRVVESGKFRFRAAPR